MARNRTLWPEMQPDPEAIVAEALSHAPIARYALFSGGDDSTVSVDWLMENVPDCQVVHFNTGIGVYRTREHARDLAASKGWPFTEIRALEDCGVDYDTIVKTYGFPGPAQHQKMYIQLKERCVELLVRREKSKINDPQRKRTARVMLATGIRHDESKRRMGYAGKEVRFRGAQMWVNPLYWRDQTWFAAYRRERNLPRNPVSEIIGISGECLCGAFAGEGEIDLINIVCPRTGERLRRLQDEVRALGFDWGWGEAPPDAPYFDPNAQSLWDAPMCAGCGKAA